MEGENIPSYNFMLITRGPVSHYCYIKNLSRLLYSQQHSEGHHYHYCVRCSQGFTTQAVFQKHRTLCRGATSRLTRIEMPEKGNNTLQFQNYQRQIKAPFVIYADCESIIEKYDTCIPPTERSSTTKTEMHKPCGFSFIAVRLDGSVTKKNTTTAEKTVKAILISPSPNRNGNKGIAQTKSPLKHVRRRLESLPQGKGVPHMQERPIPLQCKG